MDRFDADAAKALRCSCDRTDGHHYLICPVQHRPAVARALREQGIEFDRMNACLSHLWNFMVESKLIDDQLAREISPLSEYESRGRLTIGETAERVMTKLREGAKRARREALEEFRQGMAVKYKERSPITLESYATAMADCRDVFRALAAKEEEAP